ncbi:cysteine desulfurase family protein [Nocardioides caldifontis]|uniref:cysteine desulfurase family protein n=1 Tax=Nocardioides caldifontis TaxID=2588938 RepID=UPI0011DF7840|nr:aminotransferase class V-fold PLP-dependent enzyme [Nocardioides caldifontis]
MQPLSRYLDSGSSEPLDPRAREALVAAYDAGSGAGYADPLRLHSPARQARLLLDNARAAVAEALGVREDEVTFTASGTAAVHLGVLGLLKGQSRTSRTLVHSAVEHSSVFAAARWWEEHGGARTQVLPVDRTGQVVPPAAADEPAVVAVQQANPEVGTVQPLDAVAAAFRDVPLFVDACAVGARLPLPEHWAAAALSAHKWGGPAGVGVLLVRKGTRWRPPFPTDERVDLRSAGFENVPAALAAAAALQVRVAEREELARRHRTFADRLRRCLATIPDVELHGHPEKRLPHLVSFSCLYVDGEALVTELDRRGFAVASGSACTASALEPSHVLVAMGALTHGNARVTFSPATTEADVDALAAVLPEVVAELRARVDR